MSQVARVFVFLNLVIAAGFLFAASTFLALNSDWKGQFDKRDKEYATLETTTASNIKELTRQLEEARGDVTSARDNLSSSEKKIGDLQAAQTTLRQDLANKDRQIAELTTANNEHAATIERMRADVAAKQDKVDAFEAEARNATEEMRGAVAAKDEAEATADGLRDQIRDLEANVTTQADQITELEAVVQAAVEGGFDVTMRAPAPVEARVTNYDPSLRLVQINKGSNDKVVRGMLIDIVRGGNYIGRMRVDSILPSNCAGMLIIPSQGADVRVGDRATNQLN